MKMKHAIITDITTGQEIRVHATTNHPASSYGRAIWVDDDGNPYFEVGTLSPFYNLRPDPAEEHFHDVFVHVGQAVAELRQHHGWTLEEASAHSGLTVKKIAALERGVLFNNVNALAKIVESLGGRLAIVPEQNPDDPHCQFIELVDE